MSIPYNLCKTWACHFSQFQALWSQFCRLNRCGVCVLFPSDVGLGKMLASVSQQPSSLHVLHDHLRSTDSSSSERGRVTDWGWLGAHVITTITLASARRIQFSAVIVLKVLTILSSKLVFVGKVHWDNVTSTVGF